MQSETDRQPGTNVSAGEMGFYTWVVPENKLYGDPALAQLYNIPECDLAKGVPVDRILSLIVMEDRPLIAGNIHKAIMTGKPSSGAFRVMYADGTVRSLVSFGRCFRDETGEPSFYSGAVMDAAAPQVAVGDDPLEAHCRAALLLAKQGGNELAARYLSSALNVLSPRSGKF